MPSSKKTPLELLPEEAAELERIVRCYTHEYRYVVRAEIILRLARGEAQASVARTVRVRRRIVMKWEKRFREKRLAGLADAARSGRPARFSPDRRDTPGEASV